MKFDRKQFFDGYKHEFGALNDYQTAGLNRLLDGYETYYGWWDSIPQISNSLAQVGHETAHSFNPVVEGYYLAKNVPADRRFFQGDYEVVRRFQKTLRYFPDFGRGDIQLTWLENYEKMDALLRRYFPEIVAEFEKRTNQKFDLIKRPEQTLDGKISFAVMTVGMHRGIFTGHKLDDYNAPHGFDHFNARSIVNGDKNRVNQQNRKIGDVIAASARKFETILNGALIRQNGAENTGDHLILVSAAPVAAERTEAEPARGSEQQKAETAEEVKTESADNSGEPETSAAPSGSSNKDVLCKERPSTFVRWFVSIKATAGGFISMLAGYFGWSEIKEILKENQADIFRAEILEKLAIVVLFMIACVIVGGLIMLLAAWVYDRAATRQNGLNMQKLVGAQDRTKTTVDFGS